MIPTKISRSDVRNRFAIASRVALASLAIWFVATQVDLASIVEAARHADPVWIVLALALLPANLTMEALTWLPILRCIVPGVTVSGTLLGVLSGYPIGFFTPARVGDFAGRALSMRRGDRTQIGISAAVARVPDLAAVLIAGMAVLITGLESGITVFPGAGVLLAASGIALSAVLSIVLVPSVIHRVAARASILRQLEPKLRFLADLPAGVMNRAFSYSLARLAVYSTQFMLLAFAFAPEIRPFSTALAVLLTFLAKSVIPPVTFLDLGVREGAAAFFFGLVGLGSATGFDSALMLFVINLALPAVLAVPLIARFRILASARRPEVSPSNIGT